MKLLILLSVLLFSSSALSLDYAVGKVKKIRLFSMTSEPYNTTTKGLAMVYIDELPGACATTEKRIAIDSSHPLFESFLALALVSKSTGTPVNIGYQSTCNLRGNAWDFGLIELLE
ncbi:hypothetical protein [Saccharophagus degradans]|uniref:Uncharacterized protein n=1 Tax=Saccharophagus degradans TaxID=86304 RepID=A0AAW7X8A0_9GAMM|nr:hypothetical protein [Saccharophagus degradans]MDO6423515.1 hypothetical protein [Saccharophagus degradans]MDO6606920.1 hypothetical protein [Saccharophagus degradans]